MIFITVATKEMMQPCLIYLHAVSLVPRHLHVEGEDAPRYHQRDDAALSNATCMPSLWFRGAALVRADLLGRPAAA